MSTSGPAHEPAPAAPWRNGNEQELSAQLSQKARALECEVQRRIMVEQALAQRDRELRDFLESALEGLLKVGPDGAVFWVNGAGLELLGCPEIDCIGRSIEAFHVEPADARESLRRLLAGESLHDHAVALRRGDGSVRHVRITANALWDAGKLIHSRWFIRDITHERLAEGARAHLAAIVESSDDAIVSKTLDGTIRSWNQAAERLFGYSAEEAVGQPITLIIPPERVAEEAQILSRLRRGESVDHFETVRVAKSGHRIDVALTISPVHDGDGTVVGASKIARDITERRASEQAQQRAIGELKRAEEALREADRRKDEFLAVLAHELRNPLAPIRYAVAMASKDGEARRPSGCRRRPSSSARSSTWAGCWMICWMSRASRAATLVLRRAPVDLAAVVAAAQEAARPLIEARRPYAGRDSCRRSRCGWSPTRVRLAQVLANLLINAAKYTDAGGRIQLEARRAGGSLIGDCARQRHRHLRGDDAADVHSLRPGIAGARALRRRPRHRPVAGARPGGAARRHGRRVQPGHGTGKRVRGAAADRRSSGRCRGHPPGGAAGARGIEAASPADRRRQPRQRCDLRRSARGVRA